MRKFEYIDMMYFIYCQGYAGLNSLGYFSNFKDISNFRKQLNEYVKKGLLRKVEGGGRPLYGIDKRGMEILLRSDRYLPFARHMTTLRINTLEHHLSETEMHALLLKNYDFTLQNTYTERFLWRERQQKRLKDTRLPDLAIVYNDVMFACELERVSGDPRKRVIDRYTKILDTPLWYEKTLRGVLVIYLSRKRKEFMKKSDRFKRERWILGSLEDLRERTEEFIIYRPESGYRKGSLLDVLGVLSK